MIQKLRDKFNSEFTEEKYHSLTKDLDDEYNYHIDFRIAETPIFLSKELISEIENASNEILTSLQSPEFREYSKNAVPDGLEVPNEDEHTSLLAIDFAICKDANGNYIPQLIELQGFASLYCYQQLLDEMTRKNYSIPENFTNYFNGLDETSYIKLLKEVFLGDSNPENVILLEIEPEKQKTYIDFLCTEKLTGVRSVCITKIIKEGKKLFYEHEGKRINIERIYNRVIYDELKNRPDIKYNFRFSEELDVKWIAHPNWFFRISKYSLPFLKNKYVPETKFLSEFDKYPEDLENYVLKPLYSFAGAGVKFELNKSDLENIPDSAKKDYILQRKINYEPIIKTFDIPAKAELRLLYVWKDKKNDKPILVNNLVRLSKGKMMGVDFNKDKTWVGSSIAYFEK
ncbi:MAG TPA: hypothetical protein PKD83_06185 [Ignavibacteria bacterium]|nr:hypothetical protein [Ignavibacteria bacterium]